MVLSAEDSYERGRYSTDRAPFQKEILDECTNRDNRTVVVMGGAQWGKTLGKKIIQGYYIHQSPVPMLSVEPTLEMAESYSKDRFSSMIRDIPELKALIDDSRSRSSGNTILHKKFPGGHITMAGANSPVSLASRPVGIVFFDECDRYPVSAGLEGDPCTLGERRTDGFPYPLSIYWSTPTNEGASKIQSMFELTDKRRYFVPCPHCGEYQVLEWDRLKWGEDKSGNVIPDSVRYVCQGCGEGITESYKPSLLINGEWRATTIAKRPGFVGFHINSLYSPFKSWLDRIYIYKQAQGNKELLQVFYNTILGLPFQDFRDTPDWEKIYAHREFYRMNIVPSGGTILLAGADVQDDRIEVELKAFGPEMENWSVDYRKLYGNTAQQEVWNKLDDLMEESFPYETGGQSKIFRLAIDTGGHRTVQVYNFARRYGFNRVVAVKGSSQRMAPLISAPKLIDQDSQGKKLAGGVYLTIVGTDIAKDQIYYSLQNAQRTKDKFFYRMHFPDYPEEYFRGLVSESRVQYRGSGGVRRTKYVLPAGVRNEVLDCNVYVRIAAASVGVDRWTPEQHRLFLSRNVNVITDVKRVNTRVRQEQKRSRIRGRSSIFD